MAFGAFTLALLVGMATYKAPPAAAAQDRDAIEIIECEWPSNECEVTGIFCAPLCATGFCCYFEPEG
jgi:hypothetical protein